ncbi:Plasmodium vivax Vir protein, putative [Plasmodium vivax]|uniref:Vir protein, putative n=1 Tax=Plasmodium vivax TaxID=5855 RepID=A0A1G4E741_PLAVI|nr:Plasmodium vivax Vir protein, putative [Plasmodium vivax]
MKRLEFNKSFGQFLKLASIELPSKNFYNYLKSSNEGLNQHYEECKSLYSLPNTDSKIIKICEKLVKYLKTNYEEENKGDLKDHHCNLLSHWIYEQLDKKINDSFHSIIPIYGRFKFILSDVLKDPNAPQAIECLNDVHLLTFNNWKESKDLYDYCVDYDKIIKYTHQ